MFSRCLHVSGYIFFAAVGFYKVFLLFFISFFEIFKIAAGDYKVPSLAGESFNTQIFLFSFLDSRGGYTGFGGRVCGCYQGFASHVSNNYKVGPYQMEGHGAPLQMSFYMGLPGVKLHPEISGVLSPLLTTGGSPPWRGSPSPWSAIKKGQGIYIYRG